MLEFPQQMGQKIIVYHRTNATKITFLVKLHSLPLLPVDYNNPDWNRLMITAAKISKLSTAEPFLSSYTLYFLPVDDNNPDWNRQVGDNISKSL